MASSSLVTWRRSTLTLTEIVSMSVVRHVASPVHRGHRESALHSLAWRCYHVTVAG